MRKHKPNCWSLDRGYYYRNPAREWGTRHYLAIFIIVFAATYFALTAYQSLASIPPTRTYSLTSKLAKDRNGDDRFDAAAENISGRRVWAYCTLPIMIIGDVTTLGQTRPGSSEIYLLPTMCDGLAKFSTWPQSARSCVVTNREPGSSSCGALVDQTILAMHVLAHEAQHTKGLHNESTADCYALQSVSSVAESLGADEGLAHSIGLYFASHYGTIRQSPPGYALTKECRDGGALDLRPQTSDWPG